MELGQLAIVAAFLPLAHLIRRSWFYPRLVLNDGSLAVIAIALVCLTERAFDVSSFLSSGMPPLDFPPTQFIYCPLLILNQMEWIGVRPNTGGVLAAENAPTPVRSALRSIHV